jgi:hypothetical protein
MMRKKRFIFHKKLRTIIDKAQFLKIFILVFTITTFIVLTCVISYPAVSQSSQIYATVGYFNSSKSSSIIRTNEQKLKVGLDWAVFNFRKNQYLGTARVNTNYCNDCTNSKGSELILSKRYPEGGEEPIRFG